MQGRYYNTVAPSGSNSSVASSNKDWKSKLVLLENATEQNLAQLRKKTDASKQRAADLEELQREALVRRMNADVVVGRVQGDQLGSAKTELNNLLAAVQGSLADLRYEVAAAKRLSSNATAAVQDQLASPQHHSAPRARPSSAPRMLRQVEAPAALYIDDDGGAYVRHSLVLSPGHHHGEGAISPRRVQPALPAVESSVTSLGGASLVTQEELVRVLDNKMTELGKRIEKQIGRNMQSHAPPPAIASNTAEPLVLLGMTKAEAAEKASIELRSALSTLEKHYYKHSDEMERNIENLSESSKQHWERICQVISAVDTLQQTHKSTDAAVAVDGLARLENRFTTTESGQARVTTELEEQQRLLLALTTAVQKANQEIDSVKGSKARQDDLARQLAAAVNRMTDIEARVSNLGNTLIANKARELAMGASSGTSPAADSRIQTLEERLEALEQVTNTKAQLLDQNELRVQAFEAQLEAALEHMETLHTRLEDTRRFEQYDTRIKAMESQLAASAAAVAISSRAMNMSPSKSATMSAADQRRIQELESKMALVQQESSQLASVQQQTAALNAHIKQLEDVLSEEQREKEAAAALALADQKRIQELESKLSMVEKNYSQLAPIKQTATDLASRVKLLEKTLSTKEQQQKQLSATLAAEDKKRIQDLESKLASMREEYSLFEAVHQNVADLSARIEELEASKSEGGHQDVEIVAGVQAQMQDLEVKFSTMQREQSQLGAIKQQAMELKTRMQQLEKSHSARALEQEGNTKAAQMTRPGPVLSTDSASSVTADVQRIEDLESKLAKMQEDHNQLVLLRTSADEISSRVEHLEKALSEKESQEKDKVSSSYMAPSRIPTAAAAAAGGVVAVGAGAAVGAAVASGKSAGSAVVTTSRALPSISADSVAQDEINELQSSLRDVSKRVNALEGSIKTLQEASGQQLEHHQGLLKAQMDIDQVVMPALEQLQQIAEDLEGRLVATEEAVTSAPAASATIAAEVADAVKTVDDKVLGLEARVASIEETSASLNEAHAQQDELVQLSSQHAVALEHIQAQLQAVADKQEDLHKQVQALRATVAAAAAAGSSGDSNAVSLALSQQQDDLNQFQAEVTGHMTRNTEDISAVRSALQEAHSDLRDEFYSVRSAVESVLAGVGDVELAHGGRMTLEAAVQHLDSMLNATAEEMAGLSAAVGHLQAGPLGDDNRFTRSSLTSPDRDSTSHGLVLHEDDEHKVSFDNFDNHLYDNSPPSPDKKKPTVSGTGIAVGGAAMLAGASLATAGVIASESDTTMPAGVQPRGLLGSVNPMFESNPDSFDALDDLAPPPARSSAIPASPALEAALPGAAAAVTPSTGLRVRSMLANTEQSPDTPTEDASVMDKALYYEHLAIKRQTSSSTPSGAASQTGSVARGSANAPESNQTSTGGAPPADDEKEESNWDDDDDLEGQGSEHALQHEPAEVVAEDDSTGQIVLSGQASDEALGDEPAEYSQEGDWDNDEISKQGSKAAINDGVGAGTDLEDGHDEEAVNRQASAEAPAMADEGLASDGSWDDAGAAEDDPAGDRGDGKSWPATSQGGSDAEAADHALNQVSQPSLEELKEMLETCMPQPTDMPTGMQVPQAVQPLVTPGRIFGTPGTPMALDSDAGGDDNGDEEESGDDVGSVEAGGEEVTPTLGARPAAGPLSSLGALPPLRGMGVSHSIEPMAEAVSKSFDFTDLDPESQVTPAAAAVDAQASPISPGGLGSARDRFRRATLGIDTAAPAAEAEAEKGAAADADASISMDDSLDLDIPTEDGLEVGGFDDDFDSPPELPGMRQRSARATAEEQKQLAGQAAAATAAEAATEEDPVISPTRSSDIDVGEASPDVSIGIPPVSPHRSSLADAPPPDEGTPRVPLRTVSSSVASLEQLSQIAAEADRLASSLLSDAGPAGVLRLEESDAPAANDEQQPPDASAGVGSSFDDSELYLPGMGDDDMDGVGHAQPTQQSDMEKMAADLLNEEEFGHDIDNSPMLGVLDSPSGILPDSDDDVRGGKLTQASDARGLPGFTASSQRALEFESDEQEEQEQVAFPALGHDDTYQGMQEEEEVEENEAQDVEQGQEVVLGNLLYEDSDEEESTLGSDLSLPSSLMQYDADKRVSESSAIVMQGNQLVEDEEEEKVEVFKTPGPARSPLGASRLPPVPVSPTSSAFDSRDLSTSGIPRSPAQSMSAIPATEVSADGSYNISIKTNDKKASGIADDVTLTLTGSRGSHKQVFKNTGGRLFKAGATDELILEAGKDLGEVESIHVSHMGKGYGDAWNIDTITVQHPASGLQWVFSINGWVRGRDTDKNTFKPGVNKASISASPSRQNSFGSSTDPSAIVTSAYKRPDLGRLSLGTGATAGRGRAGPGDESMSLDFDDDEELPMSAITPGQSSLPVTPTSAGLGGMDGLVLEEDLADVPAAPGMTFDTSFAPIAKLPPSQQPTPRGGSLGGRPPLPPTPTGRTSNSGLRASFGSQPFPQQLGDSLMSSQEGFGLGHSDISLPGLEGREHSFSSVGSGRRLGRKVRTSGGGEDLEPESSRASFDSDYEGSMLSVENSARSLSNLAPGGIRPPITGTNVGYLGTSRKRVSFSEYSEQWDFDPGDLEGSEGSVGSISEDELLMAQGARSLQGADMGYDEMLQQGPGSSGGGGQPLSTPPKAPRSKKPPTTPGAFEDVPLGVGGRAAGTSRSKPSSAFSYKLKIFTADKLGASLDSNSSVHMEILGQNWVISQALPKADKAFQKGSIDRFTIASEAGDLGSILAIKLWHESGGRSSFWTSNKWCLARVEIENKVKGLRYVFVPDTKEGSRGGAQEQGAAWLKVGKRYAVVLKPAVDRIDEREDLMEVQREIETQLRTNRSLDGKDQATLQSRLKRIGEYIASLGGASADSEGWP